MIMGPAIQLSAKSKVEGTATFQVFQVKPGYTARYSFPNGQDANHDHFRPTFSGVVHVSKEADVLELVWQMVEESMMNGGVPELVKRDVTVAHSEPRSMMVGDVIEVSLDGLEVMGQVAPIGFQPVRWES